LCQPSRRLGRHPLAAAGATAAEQAHLGHIRPDGRQFDAFVDLLRGLGLVREHCLAFRAGGQFGVHHPIRVGMQGTAHTGTAFARRAIGTWRGGVLLLTL
jgi:hypothetical protein